MLAIGVIGGVIMLGYILFIQQDSSSLMMTTEDQLVADRLLVQAYTFAEKRMQIEALAIDTAILVDERFVNLTTFTAPVPEQPIGKTSLFEPAIEQPALLE